VTTVRLPDAPVTAGEIVYPESDGQPMGETELHRDETVNLILILRWHFRDQAEVHVGGDLFVYYEEGDPKKVFCPDVFVAFGVGKQLLRTYKVWELGQAPSVVIKVSSRKTWLEDEGNKKVLCARLGVEEYYVYDPEQDYLNPALQGFRLKHGVYRAMVTDEHGGLTSEPLGLRLRLEHGRIQLHDSRTGERLLRPDEVNEALLQAEARSAQAEVLREKSEAEIRRLRAEVERLQGGSAT